MDEPIINETNKKSFDLVLDCVIPYIQDNDDLNYVSVVSTTCRDIDSLTRKHVTVHVHYLPNPSRLSHRFPNLESLTLKAYSHGPDTVEECNIRVTPWIREIALKFKRLNSLSIRNMVVSPSDLKRLAKTRGGSLMSLEIRGCKMFSEDGLMCVARYCKHLRSLCLGCNDIHGRAHGKWLSKLAMHNTVMESLDFHEPFDSYNTIDVMKDVIRIAKKCSKSLVSLNASPKHLSDFREVFKHAKKLEHFGTVIINEGSDYSSFKFPQNMRGLRIEQHEASFSFLRPYLSQLRELDLRCGDLAPNCQCFFFKRCPSLEVLYTEDICGDKGLRFIGQFCKKLRKLTHCGRVTHLGLKAVAQGCLDLDYLEVHPSKISNKALECVGTHLKKLRDFRISLDIVDDITDSPLDKRVRALLVGRRNLDNGIRAMVEGCSKLERLDLELYLGVLTDVGLGYIGKYGHNLRYLSLSYAGESDAGLLELSKGCPKLRKLRLSGCPFSEQAIATFVFNIHSLRYLWAVSDYQNYHPDMLLTRPMVSAEAHAASTVLNFSENYTPDISTPFLDGIVSKLLVLLQNGEQMVQEGALSALTSVAESSKYYDAVMPNLKAILVNANDKANRILGAMAIECISMVGMAVGKDKFRDDAKQLMDVLMSLQGAQMETDDRTPSYIYKAWARLCMCLGHDFLPYMAVVMPPLLHSSQLKPDNEIESDDESMETITLGDKRIGIKTSVLEEKTIACNMLCLYAYELKEGFFPWIDQVASILVPLHYYYFHEEVREAAVSAMPCLLLSSKLAVEKGLAQGRDGTYLKQLSDYIVPALLEALHKIDMLQGPDTESIANMLDSLNECLQISGSLLDEKQVRSIVDEIKQVITSSSNKNGERTNAEDFDAEEGELLKEENELEEEFFDQVGKVLGTLVKTSKASFLPFFDELSSFLMPMLSKEKIAKERRIAIRIFHDVAEECREAALRYYDMYLPILLEACNDENPDIRKAAVHALGVCAEHGGVVIKPLIGEALSRLNAVIRHPNALDPDNVMTYYNVVSTLGKVCHFHRDSIDSAQAIPAWLNCLPIKEDVIEAKAVHELLFVMVERSDAELLGPKNQYLPKIVSIFAEIICDGKDLASDQTISRIINLLRQLQLTLPPATLASTWSALQPQQQMALQSILSSPSQIFT